MGSSNQKKVGGVVATAGAIGLWLMRGTLETWFFDKVLNMIAPYPSWSLAIEYGPPLALTAIAVWLLWSGRKTPKASTEAQLDSAREEFKAELQKRAAANRARLGEQPQPANLRNKSLEKLQEEAHFAHGFNPTSAEAKKAAVLLLARLRSEGVELRNEADRIVDKTLDDWQRRIHEWMNAVIDGLTLVDAVDAEIFRTLDVVGPARVNFLVKVVNPDRVHGFIHHYQMHDLRVSRLWDLLQKYQGVTFRG